MKPKKEETLEETLARIAEENKDDPTVAEAAKWLHDQWKELIKKKPTDPIKEKGWLVAVAALHSAYNAMADGHIMEYLLHLKNFEEESYARYTMKQFLKKLPGDAKKRLQEAASGGDQSIIEEVKKVASELGQDLKVEALVINYDNDGIINICENGKPLDPDDPKAIDAIKNMPAEARKVLGDNPKFHGQKENGFSALDKALRQMGIDKDSVFRSPKKGVA